MTHNEGLEDGLIALPGGYESRVDIEYEKALRARSVEQVYGNVRIQALPPV